MVGFVGTSGRHFSDSQRRAMFFNGNSSFSIGAPYVPTSSELMKGKSFDGYAPYSKRSGASLNVERVRDIVKKQYPEADVDTSVSLLPPDEYMETALRENPGRESEALTSNGFYSPTDDKTYLEIDSDRINTLRAMAHEFAHDMSDEGVMDDGLNEGYAEYVAKRVMVDEIGIPTKRVDASIGYPEELKKVEELVELNGRKKVDKAFLCDHSLENLEVKSAI